MGDNNQDEFDRPPTPATLRMATKGEKAFYGGPLCGSFDFTPPEDDMLAWQPRRSTLIHIYERDITGRMCYRGLGRDKLPGELVES